MSSVTLGSPAIPFAQALPFGADKPWLAPLAGYSDLPFRLLCREYGAAVCETEMVSAKGLLYASPGTEELLHTTPADQPLVGQLFGADPLCLGRATELLQRKGFVWFDLNLGCSVPKVMRQGAGAALLGQEDMLLHAAQTMIHAAGFGRVGFKLRLGLDRTHPVLPDLALRLEDLGAGWISVHPRTAREGFQGKARWEVLPLLAKRLSIPLVASGDLFSAADGLRCLEETKVSAVMYARGALRNPAIFSDHRRLLAGQAPSENDALHIRTMIERHIHLIREHAPQMSSTWKMRSVIPRYVHGLPGARALRQALCSCTTWQELEKILNTFLPT
ncbi:MAG: tRNA-dihydrouridine synthase family protein [Desulfovibrio sp.]|nr:tRNA-dihydrouridine synthase family protein [Desulfovibrio sp.]